MIDQTKDKKEEALEAKKDDSLKMKPEQVQRELKVQQEQAELQKNQQQNANKLAPKADSNTSNAMQPLGSAVITAEKAELRSQSGQKGDVIGTLSSQQKVDILEKNGTELKVLVNGKVGYISAKSTEAPMQDGKGKAKSEAKPAPVQKAAPSPIGTASVSVASLNIRKGPSKDEQTVGTLREADKVNFYGEKDGFLEVHIGDQIGYIAAEHTDKASKNKGRTVTPKTNDTLAEASPELQAMLSKETLTVAEIGHARELIAQVQQSKRGTLYEALLSKQPKAADEKTADTSKQDPSSLGNLAACLEMLGIKNPGDGVSYAAYLDQIRRDNKLSENGGMQTWGSIANAMGVNYSALLGQGDTQGADKTFWSTVVREQLQQGHPIMVGLNNQAVRVEALEDKGIVLSLNENDSEAMIRLSSYTQTYSGKAETQGKGRKLLMSYEMLHEINPQWLISLG